MFINCDVPTEVDEIDFKILSGTNFRLDSWGYLQGTYFPYRGICLHLIVAKRMGLDVSKIIDHEDRNKLNNQSYNLREATKSQNNFNSKLRNDNTTGYRGIYWHNLHQKYEVKIQINGDRINFGLFKTMTEAKEVRNKAILKYNIKGFFNE